MRPSLPYSLSVWWRNARMYRRSWKLNLLPNFFEPVFYLAAIGLGVGAYIQQMGGVSYREFLAPGLVCVAAMNGASYETTWNFYIRMNFEKTYSVMLTTPIQPVDILMGELLWSLTRSGIYGAAFILVTTVFGLAQSPWAVAAIAVVPLTGLLFSALGFAFSLRINNIELFSFYYTLFLTPLFLFSDVFFPIQERLSGYWLWLAEALPLLHPVRLARMCYAGEWSLIALWDIAYILILSWVLLRWAYSWMLRRMA